jgi:hypothetical protein
MKQETHRSLVKKLDEVFSMYIRLRDSDEYGFIRCVSCNKKVHWKEANNCHFVDRQHMILRFSEINCHAGCVQCNAWNKGFHIFYYAKFLNRKYGDNAADILMLKGKETYKYTLHELRELITYYKQKVKENGGR